MSCVHPVAVLNAAFYMTCSLLMLVEDARGDHVEEAYSRAGLITALYEAMSVSFCLPHPVAVSDFMICRSLCACTDMLWICVLNVSFGSKVRPRTFGCVAMGSALLCILRRSPRMFITSSISAGTGSSWSMWRPVGMWCGSALSITVRKIFSSLWQSTGRVGSE